MSTPESAAAQLREVLDNLYRTESRRILATLIRLLGDFDLAEDALHEAFRVAVEQWPRDGVPVNPRAWLISTGRFKAIDALRRRARFEAPLADVAERLDAARAAYTRALALTELGPERRFLERRLSGLA